MKPLIIFDFDGTLADPIDTLVSSINEVAHEHNTAAFMSRELLASTSLQKAIRKLGISFFRVHNFISAVREEFHNRMQEVSLHSHIPELLQEVHNHARLAIISSNTESNIQELLSQEIQEYFFHIESAGMFTKSKHITSLRKQLGLKKHEVLYIGDESRDMHAARRASVECMAVTWGVQHKDSLLASRPTMLAQTATQATHLLKAWIVSRN